MSNHLGSRTLQIILLLLLFTVVGTWKFRHAVGEDLSSSYVGCRLLVAGEGAHLYAHDPVIFSMVRDPVWNDIAAQAQFAPLNLLHPYVQPPLWAYSLGPLCSRTNFRTFCHLFLLLSMLCTAGIIWLVARYWVPTLFQPVWIVLLCFALSLSDPFQYAMFLTQTHLLYIFLIVLALVLDQKERPLWAGLALALAASVKITPGFLLLYWLLSRRYKASVSFIGFSVLLVAVTILLTGPALFLAYLRELSEVSNVLLVAFNNQSLAAWSMGRQYPASELFNWRIYPLPSTVKWISLSLSVLCGVLGGLLDRTQPKSGATYPPYGALFTMVGCTMFAAIAWNHYYVLLVIPIMFLLGGMYRRWPVLWGALAVTLYALKVYPVAYGSILHFHRHYSLVRSQFYSGVVCLLALVLLRWLHRESHDGTSLIRTGDGEQRLHRDPGFAATTG